MSNRTIFRALSALAVVVSAAAPVPLRAQQESDKPAQTEQAPMLKVTNNNWLDMHIYVSRPAGPLLSLGVVTTNSTMKFRLPEGAMDAGAGLRVVADPIGATGIYVSPDILVGPKSDVVLDLENTLALSHVSVEPQMNAQ